MILRMSSNNIAASSCSQNENISGNEMHVIGDVLNKDFVEMELKPYRYMVGGHSYVLEVTKSAICKNLREKESVFYKNMPEELRPFTPQYLGEINVMLHTENGHKQFTSNIPQSIVNQCLLLEKHHNRTDTWTNKDDQSSRESFRKMTADYPPRFVMELEEWSNTCLERYNRAAGTWENNQSKKFMVLENLLLGYHCPSVLDIKLGKCPNVDFKNSSDDVIHNFRFRIDGYKKFDISTGSYVVLHKDTTRHFNTDQVIEEIGNFFHDGSSLRTDAILRILQKLDSLLFVINQKRKWTFQAASLLLMFDNNSSSLHNDFSTKTNCLSCGCSGYDTPSCPEDVTYIGRRNEYLLADAVSGKQHPYEQNISGSNSTSNCACVTLKELPECFNQSIYNTRSDVKLIDFLKTDECSQGVDENGCVLKGVEAEVLKIKAILLQLLDLQLLDSAEQ